MTFQDINAQFESELRIGKRISQDTLWFYINTLKALGCQITRPTSKNNYCYQINYHPFAYFLTSQDLQSLKEIIHYVDEDLDYADYVYLNQWLKQVFRHAANCDRETLEHQFFTEMRLIHIKNLENIIADLEIYCQERQLLKIQYHSPVNGFKIMTLLARNLFYEQGNLYLLGQSQEREKISMLRLDRIQSYTPIVNPDLSQRLWEKVYERPIFILRLLNCTLRDYEPIGDQDEVYPDPASKNNLIVKMRFDNEFLLTQKLLSSGYCFQVIQPLSFKQELEETLSQMRLMYCE